MTSVTFGALCAQSPQEFEKKIKEFSKAKSVDCLKFEEVNCWPNLDGLPPRQVRRLEMRNCFCGNGYYRGETLQKVVRLTEGLEELVLPDYELSESTSSYNWPLNTAESREECPRRFSSLKHLEIEHNGYMPLDKMKTWFPALQSLHVNLTGLCHRQIEVSSENQAQTVEELRPQVAEFAKTLSYPHLVALKRVAPDLKITFASCFDTKVTILYNDKTFKGEISRQNP